MIILLILYTITLCNVILHMVALYDHSSNTECFMSLYIYIIKAKCLFAHWKNI